MPLATLLVDRLDRLESTDGLPGWAVAADRAVLWNALVKCVVMLCQMPKSRHHLTQGQPSFPACATGQMPTLVPAAARPVGAPGPSTGKSRR
jgi:hypothetical protein